MWPFQPLYVSYYFDQYIVILITLLLNYSISLLYPRSFDICKKLHVLLSAFLFSILTILQGAVIFVRFLELLLLQFPIIKKASILLLKISLLLSKLTILFLMQIIHKIIPKLAFCVKILSRGDESCLKMGGGGGHKYA